MDNKKYENNRKFKELEIKIVKMAGYLTDYYIDQAIETDDFSIISSFLIDYFSGSAGKPFEIGYLTSKFKEFKLDEKIEDIDFNINDWYRIKYENDNQYQTNNSENTINMSEEDYINYLIELRKKDKLND